ncbi:MAG TPA: FkbM family methyltransferase [Longimicrobiales bacterium]|nr:FkbM family methyltransferase [Longimicrobiales bacterium]
MISRVLRTPVKRVLRAAGWELRRYRPRQPAPPLEAKPDDLTFLDGVLTSLLAHVDPPLTICQVGAFDGVAGDPIHDFLLRHKERTRALLIEPQPAPFDRCVHNYGAHPDAHFVNAAVGPPGQSELTLYLTPSAGQQGSSGVSANREHRIRMNAWRMGVPEEEAALQIRTIKVPSYPLRDLLKSSAFGNRVHVLQVDCEGFDDEVLYASSVPELLPWVINYESVHLTKDRAEKLQAWLHGLGYEQTRWNERDTCALLRR